MKAFEKIIGYSAVKAELIQIADTLKNSDAYKKLGVCAPKGLLLHGDPGVGKTLMATCLIEASERRVFICRKDQPNGDFIKAIKETFTKAAGEAPSIVFLDDMDKFANGDESHKDAEEYVTVQSCIDGLKTDGADVFVLATANNIRNLPGSLKRAGRFDRVIEIEAPRGRDAEAIIHHYLSCKNFASGIDMKFIARVMDGHSCAELETVLNEAGLYAGFERMDSITMDHFMKAYMRMFCDVSPDDCDDDDDMDFCSLLSDGDNINSQIVYHEAGHAVISEILRPESVTIVSANGKGRSIGGFTICYNDRKATPMLWQQSRAVVSLGGMAAIEQRFGIADCGTESDLDHAFSAVSDLVKQKCTCGLSLHEPPCRESETILSRQEDVIAAEMERYFRKAKEILAKNSELLNMVAVALAKKGLLTTPEIQKIKAECTIVPVSI